MNPYSLTITDSDGEEHDYNFLAPTAWHVTSYVIAKMATERDFYGHRADMTIGIEVAALVKAGRSPIIAK
jgi:hypothetical protein